MSMFASRIVRIRSNPLRFVLWTAYYPWSLLFFIVRGVLFEGYRPNRQSLRTYLAWYWLGVDGVLVGTPRK